MLQEIVFQISKRHVDALAARHTVAAHGGASTGDYSEWRDRALEAEFTRYFSPDLIRDKDVLDFGCGSGALSFLLIRLGAKSSVGIDLYDRDIALANERIRGEPVSFRCASSTNRIDLESSSVDVVACFDVMEHIIEYESIMREWHRVLRPNGKVLISWQPWFHPYGHHAQGYLPVPWVHVLLSNRQRDEVCARVVDLPNFQAPWWDMDEHGNRINRFRDGLKADKSEKSGFLNELTMRRFEQMCKQVELAVEKRTFSSFQGPLLVRAASSLMTRIPGVREFFTANAGYILSKRQEGLKR